MQILNFGSLNIDYVYRIDTFVQPGETKSCRELLINSGGKGLNQSIAAARAGIPVFHAGYIGRDGGFLVNKLAQNGVDVSLVKSLTDVSGHAIIQVDDKGQNCILLFGGTNQQLNKTYIYTTLEKFGSRGCVLLQNETNLVDYIIEQASKRGLLVALNAAPMSNNVREYPLDLLNWLIINEVEGKQLAECNLEADIIPILRIKYPNTSILLTLGKRGASCWHENQLYSIGSLDVKAVDTTAAGDTFTGYFLAGFLEGNSVVKALELATTASALCVQRLGASDSIPNLSEVKDIITNSSLGKLEVRHIDTGSAY